MFKWRRRKQPFDPNQVRMSLGEHLEELRKRIIWGFAGPLVLAVGVLFFGRTIITWLCMPLYATLAAFGLEPQLSTLTPFEAFGTYMKVSLIGGIILGLPWLLYQLWLFVAAGLYEKEQRLVVSLFPGSLALSVAGVLFMYFLMLPVCLVFLIGFSLKFPPPSAETGSWFTAITTRLAEKWQEQEPEQTQPADEAPRPSSPPQAADSTGTTLARLPRLRTDPTRPVEGQIWLKVPEYQVRLYMDNKVRTLRLTSINLLRQDMRLSDYISFVMRMALAFAVSFQLPLVMVLVATVRLADFRRMAAVWKFVLLGCFIIGAILTPADPLSQIMLAVPMFALYGLGLWLAWLIGRRQRAGQPADGSGEA